MTKRRKLGWAVIALIALAVALWWSRAAWRPAVATAPAVPEAPAPAPTAPAKRAPPARPAQPPAPVPAVPDDTAGAIDGRVIDGTSHRGVADAELTFSGDAGVATFHTSSDGTFELTPTATGRFTLVTITAAGYLPYVPEIGGGAVQVTLAHGRSVHGVTLVLYPAIDRQGRVVDAHGAPVAAARVRLIGGRGGAPLISVDGEWKTDRDGLFTFQAADGSVLEARRGGARGWASVESYMAQLHQRLTIRLGQPLNDATITGRVRGSDGAPIGDAMVRATPSMFYGTAASAFTTTARDGSFTLSGVDRAAYDVTAEAEDHLPSTRINILGGSRNLELDLDTGLRLAGQVADAGGAPVPSYKLLVTRRAGAARPVAIDRTQIDPEGRFDVRVPRGDYDILVVARGCARAEPVQAAAGTTDVRIVLGGGATLRGRVVAGDGGAPIAGAAVACELARGRIDSAPLDAGAVTAADGSFELGDVPPGPVTFRIRAAGYNDRVATAAASDAAAAPVLIELSRIDPEDLARTEMVGIGVQFYPDGNALRITRVVPGSGAFDAGLGFGDRIVAIEGVSVAALGVDAAFARLSGAEGTTVSVTVRRDGDAREVDIVIERRLLRGA